MSKAPEAVYLPQCPMNPEAYEQLYAFNGKSDDFLDTDADWQEIRLKAGLNEEEVYRLLPSTHGIEYGGYLTSSRIRFLPCDSSWASMPRSKACTFHSHPTDLPTADVPSASDVFQFLNYRHLRAITVGATRLWVWDKTKATMPTVKKLGTWVEANMLSEVRRLEKKFPYGWQESYTKLVLNNLGLIWPKKFKEWEKNWDEMLRKILRFKVRIFPRDPGEKLP